VFLPKGREHRLASDPSFPTTAVLDRSIQMEGGHAFQLGLRGAGKPDTLFSASMRFEILTPIPLLELMKV